MLEFLLFSVSVPEGLIARFHMTIHTFLFYALFFLLQICLGWQKQAVVT